MDGTDQKILSILRSNARTSHARLGEMVCLSRNAIRQRIERMEAKGIIAGYTLTRHPDRHVGIAALMFVYRHDRLRGGDLLAAFSTFPEVVSCEILSGDFDIVIRVETQNAERVSAIWQEIAAMPSVKDIHTSIVLASRFQG